MQRISVPGSHLPKGLNRMRTWICTVIAVSLVQVQPVVAASIGLFSTPDCSSCNLSAPLLMTEVFYVNVITTGLPNSGVVGAEFRITGLPVGWHVTVTSNPNADTMTGDLFGNGAGITFPEKGLMGNCVNLYTIAITNLTGSSEVALRVDQRLPPGPPCCECPRVVLNCPCGAFCVGGGTLFINSNTECTVAVERNTWGGMKQLYR